MTRAQRERLRKLIDRAKRRRLQRATIATDADLRMWQEADEKERREEGRAA